MAQFLCRFVTENNVVSQEIIQASEREELVNALRQKGYRVIHIEEVRNRLTDIEIGSRHIKKKSLTLFCRQMSTMLVSGIPMVKCFDVIGAQSDDKTFRKLMAGIANDVSAGSSLSRAMEKYPDDFPEMLREMVKVGEVTGDLDGVLTRMAEQYEQNAKITQKIKSALTYPIVVMFIAVIACVFMLVKIVPSFVDVFASLNTELPGLTQLLLDVSEFITKKWYLAIMIIVLVVIVLIRLFRTRTVRRAFDKFKLTFGLIKGPMQKLASARFARSLYTLISSGVPIVQALEYTKKNVLNLYVEEYVDKIITGIRQGKGLAYQMAQVPVFPKLMISMLSVGESSGDLEGMLAKTADYFDDETASTIEQLMTIIEPVMIVFVGLLIGVIVVALYSPMLGIFGAMQGSL